VSTSAVQGVVISALIMVALALLIQMPLLIILWHQLICFLNPFLG